jgi:methanogenic corrinoid protein MtbC1
MTAYRYVRLGMLAADKVGGRWRVDPRDLVRLQARAGASAEDDGPARDRAATVTRRRQWEPWVARLRLRMLAGDVEGSWQVVESALASGAAPADVYVAMVGPALHAIGAGWQRGEIGIEQEHLASGVAASIVGRLGPRFRRRGRRRGNVLVAMPIGERHGLGAAMLSDILRGDGHGVLNLGPHTPPSSLVAAMAATDDVVAVIVSVVDQARLPAAEPLIAAVRRQDPGVIVIAGGFAVDDERAARSLGADGWTDDPRSLAALISELSAHRPGPVPEVVGPSILCRSIDRGVVKRSPNE